MRRPENVLTLCTFVVMLLSMCLPLAQARALDYVPDPMHPMRGGWSDESDMETGLTLQSILVAGNRRSAVINGQLLTIGSRIDNSRIIGIMHDAVIISQNGRRKVLRLNTRNIVTRSRSQENAHE